MPAPTFPLETAASKDRNCILPSGPYFRVRAAGVTFGERFASEDEARAWAFARPPSAFPPGTEERHWAHVREMQRAA